MPRFLLGDELGHIKSLRYLPDQGTEVQSKASSKTIYKTGGVVGLQGLALSPSNDGPQILAATFADGSLSAFHLHDDDTMEEWISWTEPRLKEHQRFVGLSASGGAVFSCTSNGALHVVDFPREKACASPLSSRSASLPTRLRDWQLSAGAEKFAYGGDEVEVSIWNTELAFRVPREDVAKCVDSKKRKRDNTLFPAELWRAKNVANDALGLRQPVRITSLAFLDPASDATHLIAGTELGDARRYDTRAGRRPVAEIKSIGRVGGVKVVKKGANENEVFISDNGSNLFSVDLRNGKIVYGYKGLSGSVNAIAATPDILATTALDRFARIHSIHPPPKQIGQQQDHRGNIIDKVFTKSIPTCVVWDGASDKGDKTNKEDDDDDDDDEEDDIWHNMQHIIDESETEGKVQKHRKKS